MNKDFLAAGQLEQDISFVRFKEGNKVEAEINFGCSILIYGSDKDDDMDEVDHQLDQLFDLINSFVDNEDNNKEWRPFRKLFMSTGFEIEFDFSNDDQEMKMPFQDNIEGIAKMFGVEREIGKLKFPKFSEILPFHFAKVKTFEPVNKEVRIFDSDSESGSFNDMPNEAQNLDEVIKTMRSHEFWENPIIKPIAEYLFGYMIPVAPFPQVESCLGFKPKTSHMSINEGYSVMSIDYDIQKSHKDCFFRMQEWKKEMKAQ